MATRGTTNGFRTTAWGASALALVLFIATAALTISKVYRTDPHASFIDAFICLGPNTLLSALSGLAMLGLGLLARGRRRSIAVAVGMAVWAMLVLSLSMLAHQSWERSGTLLDWKLFSYTLQHYDELQAVIGSETSWTSWLVLGGVTLLGLLPVGLDAAYSRWPIKPPPTRAALKVLVPTAAVAAGLLFVSPSSPRVHRYARAAAPSILVGAVLESWNQAEAAAAPPPVETSILVRDKLRRHPPVRTPTETTPANLLVIVLESTRWDATTVYNPELPTTPNMVKLADRGLVPEAVYVDMPHTSKALVSTLCGYPARWVQNIEEAEAGGLNRPCLAHILDSLGYSTAFFQSATGKFENRKRLTENFGYKFFRSLENYDSRGFEQTNYLGLEDKVMVKPLLSWIDEQTGEKKPFFATMLTTISHHDYGLPTSMPFIDIVHGIASSRYNRYLNTVKYADSFIGDVVAGLEKRGLLDDTLIAIVGDHGQAFFEHGRKGHNDIIWEEGLRIPMILSNPKIWSERNAAPGMRRQVDLAQTALRLMGVSFDPAWFDGRDLETEPPYDSVISSCWYDDKCMAEHRDGKEFITHFEERPMEVYDLTVDPKEKKDLLDEASGADTPELRAAAEASRKRMLARRDEINAMFHDPDTDQSWVLKKEPVPEHIVYARYGDNVEVLGWDGPTTVDPGSFWDITVYFRCLQPTEEGFKFFAHLETVDGRRIKVDHDPAKGRLTLDKCKNGMLVADPLSFYVPPTYPAGELTLWYGLYRKRQRIAPTRTSLKADGERVPLIRPRVTDNYEPELQELLAKSVHRTPPPPSLSPVRVEFSDYLELVDLRLEPTEARRRSEFEVVATWHVKKRLEGGWRLFLHMDPVRGKKVRQDASPMRGMLPIDTWEPGTWIEDRYPVYISHNWGWPTGEFVKIYIGIYEADERLRVTDPGKATIDDDRVLAGKLKLID